MSEPRTYPMSRARGTYPAPKSGHSLGWPEAIALTVALVALGLIASGLFDSFLPWTGA
jgi:hypothetical protein